MAAPLVDRRWLVKAGIPLLLGALIVGIVCGAADASKGTSMVVEGIYIVVAVLVIFRIWDWRRWRN